MKAKNRTIFHDDVEKVLSRLDDSTFTLIYIDPPWNTSRECELEKDAGKNNCDYERFLTRVLQNCRRLLSDEGAIYIHTPPVSSVNYRLILDQIFEKSASLEIVWKARQSSASREGHSHDKLLRYNKTAQSVYNPITAPPDMSRYSLGDARGPYLLLDLTTSGLRAMLHYTWRGFEPPAGRSWRFNLERMEQYLAEGRIVIPANGRPRLKQYFDESIGADIGSVWDDIKPIMSHNPSESFTQKPVELVSRIIRQASNEGDWVLDPFFGTGSLLVEAEKLKRKWVGCDNDAAAVAVCRKRLIEQSGVIAADVTMLDSNDLKNFQPVAASEGSIFVSIAELTEAKNRLQQISKIVSEIRAGMVAKDSSDEDILDAMLDKCSSVGLVISSAAREDCQLHLSAEIDLFEKLSPASKDFLVTALFTLETHQDGFDFSFVSLGAWKAIELELAIQIFSPFKQWFVTRHPNVTEAVALDLQNSKSAKLASFLKGKKDMALGEMQWNLNLLATSEKTIKSSLCLQDFQMFVISHFKTPDFILKPTGITESISQENIDRYRNGAAHTTLFSRTKAEESLKFVKGILPRLISGLLPKESKV
jgi:DNA modification methylase